ncbi:hypothetical protein [Streptomyces lydicus]|uniref:hypothetical protein n=1 Tax=Streptomyces lydicus TaxID=47763 RepID=UPI0037BD6C3A
MGEPDCDIPTIDHPDSGLSHSCTPLTKSSDWSAPHNVLLLPATSPMKRHGAAWTTWPAAPSSRR